MGHGGPVGVGRHGGRSGLAFLDATTVDVALPALGEELDASVAGLQWTVNGYTLALASLILLGGSLADRPLLGGWLIDALSWRWISFANDRSPSPRW